MNFKPMLADEVDLKTLRYPVLASPKIDGVRATFVNGRLLSRSLKPFGNQTLGDLHCATPLDGELIVGDPTDKSIFPNTMKIVSAHGADIKDIVFYAFDIVGEMPFAERLMMSREHSIVGLRTRHVYHVTCYEERDLLVYENEVLSQGYEGVMLRDPQGKYKFGRSTKSEQGLLKLKRKLRSEARVIGFEELMHNANELKTDNLGYADRSTHKANMIPMGTLGALIVEDVKTKVQFNIGTGFTQQDRMEIWKLQPKGMLVSYEYLPSVKDKPRCPVFIGFRAEEDMCVPGASPS
jgi:DNA ligase-1